VRDRHDAALVEDRKAAATLRQTLDAIKQLDEAVARLTPEARQHRVEFYRQRQGELARQLTCLAIFGPSEA